MVAWLGIPLSPIYAGFNSWLIPSPHVLGSILKSIESILPAIATLLFKKKKIEVQI